MSSAAEVRRNGVLAGIALLLLAGCATTLTPTASNDFARELLLTVAQPADAAIGLTGPLDSRYLRRRGYGGPLPEVDRVLDQLAREHGLQRKEGWSIRSLDLYCEVFVVPDGLDIEAVLERLQADPRVDLAQSMNVFQTFGSRYNDPYADLQPAALDLGVELAHTLATGRGVRVAVIDSGIDADHPELAGRVTFQRDVVEPRGRGAAAEVHGTAVAGVIASAANNEEGIFGIAPDVEVAALRACWPAADEPVRAACSSFTLAQALEIAIAIRSDVINLSLAGPADPLLERLVREATVRGAVVVGAMPPAGDVDVSFPASSPNILSARAPGDMRAASPSALPAPAEEILTTIPGGGYAILSGTSLAAAHLSGIVALLRERSPDVTMARAAELLRQSLVRRQGGMTVSACHAVAALADVSICGLSVAAVAVPTTAAEHPKASENRTTR